MIESFMIGMCLVILALGYIALSQGHEIFELKQALVQVRQALQEHLNVHAKCCRVASTTDIIDLPTESPPAPPAGTVRKGL